MESRELSEVLFGCGKEDIKILGAEKKQVCSVGPAGIGHSKARTKGARANTKYSGAAKVLDYLIVDKVVNALEFDSTRQEMIYTEFKIGGNLYQATFDDKCEASYTGDIPSGYAQLIPAVIFALSSDSKASETKEYFEKIVAEYNSTGSATIQSILGFCDSFYYEFVVQEKMDQMKIYDDDLAPATIKQAYESAYADEMPILSEVAGKPLFDILDGVEMRSAKKKGGSGAKVSSDLASCIAGDHIIPYEWSEEQKRKIPELDTLNEFIPSDAFYSVLKKIKTRMNNVLTRWDTLADDATLDDEQKRIKAIGKDYINLFIVGKPGTGKTTAAYALGAATGMPVYTVAMTKNTEEDTFQGMTKVVEGNFKFVSTDFLDAYTNGGIIILEEVNLPDPAVIMGALGQAVEAPFILQKDGYQTIRRHPMCVIIATMNIGTNGAKGVNQAFSSRFKQTYILDDPKKEDFISILEKQGAEHKKCEWVYDAYTRINNYLKSPEVNSEEICLNVTLRGCIGALENMAEGDSPKEAIRNTLIGKIAEVDLELAENVNKDVVSGLPNLR